MKVSAVGKRHLVVVLILALMLSLTLLLGGCVAQGADTDDSGGEVGQTEQAHQGESEGADSGGFVIEASAEVVVDINEEGS